MAWKTFPFPEFAYFQEGPGVRRWEFKENGIHLMNIKLMTDIGTIDRANARYVTKEDAFGKWMHLGMCIFH